MKPKNHQWEQLPMFMRPSEILNNYKFGDEAELANGDLSDDPDDVYEQKYNESVKSGLAKDIEKEGVKEPVLLSKTHLLDGHHRVVAAHSYAYDKWIPVTHTNRSRLGSYS